MVKTLFIANRGEIACRIIRTARQMGIATISVYSAADAQSLHVTMADDAVPLSGDRPYLDIAQIIRIAKEAKADAIHPGYGFLSENPKFAEACVKAKLTFVGPPAEAMRQMGNKVAAKQLIQSLNVPTVPGVLTDLDNAAKAVDTIGYPILVKAAAGGGGKGMRVVEHETDLKEAIAAASREALAAFGDGTVFVEKLIRHPRHVEIQIMADAHGHVVHLFERDCSTQRRHQKIIEESPSLAVTPALRQEMGEVAVRIAKAAGYVGAGTIEFLVDADHYYFLEMNTRLQVEHSVTEMVTGLDLVEWQLRIAAGEAFPWTQDRLKASGHAIECRIYAENPRNGFLPVTGRIERLCFPKNVRVDCALVTGTPIGVDFDPMIAKLTVHAPSRAQAISNMIAALSETELHGVTTNRSFLIDVLRSSGFCHGNVDTHFVETFCMHWSEFPAPKNDPFSPWHGSVGSKVNHTAGVTKRGRHKLIGSLNAPMPGRIIKVLVAEGDSVDAGDTLMVMEAMKMEHAIKAPAAGTVTQLHYGVGDLVELGKKLLEVE